MADRKNIVTLGIGATPGKLLWFLTSGLETGAVDISPYPPIATFELAPGLPITASYQTVDIPVSRQMISLDSLPLGDSMTTNFLGEILWDDETQVLWDGGTVIEWDESVMTPSVIELRS